MSDHAVPILLNHDHTKPIGVFEAGVVTFLPDHRPTKEEFFTIFGNVGFRPLESFVDRNGTVRIGMAEIHEFSISIMPTDPRAAHTTAEPPAAADR